MQAIRAEQKPLGVVYTPPELTEPMTRLALAPLLDGRTVDEIAALRICDPATGDGAFLHAVVEVIAERLIELGEPAEAARVVAAGCVRGVDVDPAAVAEARAALGLRDDQLLVADALGLDWAAAFPDVIGRGGFDAVVGNPPYVRQEYLAAHKPQLRRFASYDGVADLYVYFVELVHQLVRPGGRYCLVTPNKWLTAAYGRALRGYLAAQGSVDGVLDLARTSLFEGADAFPCIVWGTLGGPSERPIQAARLAAGAAIELGAAAPHARARWGGDPWHIDVPADGVLIERMAERWPRLGELIGELPSRGVVTGCNRAFVIDRATRERLLAEEPAAAAVIRPLIKGRDVRSWLPIEPERWILLVDRGASVDELPRVVAHLAQFREALEPRPVGWREAWPGRKPGSYRWYELQDAVGPLVQARAPRLLYQDIQTAPACCLDGGELVPDTTVWLLASDDLFLLAVLNAPLYGWYARRRFPPALNGSVRPKREHLCRFPIAQPGPGERAAIEQLVGLRLAIEPDRRTGCGDAAASAAELDAAIADAVHDVYELSIAERALVAS